MVTSAHILEVEHKSGTSVHRRIALLALAVTLVGTASIAVWWATSTRGSGDPGGHVLAQLTPTISAVPSTAKVTYVWKQEPHQESCDGLAGSQGWSQVVVQSGFKWQGSVEAVAAAMAGRLVSLGWSSRSVTVTPSASEVSWRRSLLGGSTAQLLVTQEGSYWQLDAIAPPVGKAVGDC